MNRTAEIVLAAGFRPEFLSIEPDGSWAGFTDGEEGATHLVVPYTRWGDHIGTAVDRANYRALQEDFEDTVVAVEVGSWNMLGIPLDADVSAELSVALVRLWEHPLYSDQMLSELVNELVTEGWDDYIEADLRTDLDVDTSRVSSEDLHYRFFRLLDKGEFPYEAEGATSVTFPRWADMLERVADGLREDSLIPV